MNSELLERGDDVRADDEDTQALSAPVAAKPADAAKASALVTLDPEAFTAAVYKPFRERLASVRLEANALYDKKVDEDGKAIEVPNFDITTTAGLKQIEALRTKFRKVRTEADNERKARVAPLTVIQKRLIEVYGELDTDVRKDENKFQGLIDDEVARKAAEAEKKRLAEIARVEALQEKVRAINARVLEATGQSPSRIAEIRTEIMAIDPTEEEYQELAGAALRAQRETCIELDRLHAAAVEQARRDDEAEKNRLELERLRAENEKAARANAIRDQIVSMRELSQFDGLEPSTDLIKDRIAECDAIEIDETTFGDQHQVAQLVMAGVRDKLNTAKAHAEAREKDAADALEAERIRKAEERQKHEDTERENASLREQLAAANLRAAAAVPAEPPPSPEPVAEIERFSGSTAGYSFFAADPEPAVTSAGVAEVVACVTDLPPVAAAAPARPTDLQIVRAVADAFSVDTTTAMDWVHSIDFVALSDSL